MTTTRRVEAVREGDRLVDVLLVEDGRTRRMAGRDGPARERALVDEAAIPPASLPVLLGSGLGEALARLLETHPGPVCVVDKESDILAAAGLRERFPPGDGLVWIDAATSDEALAAITRFQMAHGGRTLHPLALPFHLRLDPPFYRALQDRLAVSQRHNFWEKARTRRFTSWPPRILGVTSQYFLMGEITAACRRLGVPHLALHLPDQEIGAGEFVERLLAAVLEFQPDFLLTINHLGVDREGVLLSLLDRLDLPLASWFVDNPHLILAMYDKVVHPLTALFTWDRDNLPTLRAMGFERVHWLPLGTDAARFRPGLPPWPGMPRAEVSFVGNSMRFKVGHRLKKARPPREFLLQYRELARQFGESHSRNVLEFLETHRPDMHAVWQSLPTPERRLALEALLTWEATRQYRVACVEALLPFRPLLCGDPGWLTALRRTAHPWTRFRELGYYDELPAFYPAQTINFNTTSKQMKGAVNQRVFDCPASGAFVLADAREQLAELLEPGKEIAIYEAVEEIGDRTRWFLRHESERRRLVERGRARVLAEHTYDARLLRLCETMRGWFA